MQNILPRRWLAQSPEEILMLSRPQMMWVSGRSICLHGEQKLPPYRLSTRVLLSLSQMTGPPGLRGQLIRAASTNQKGLTTAEVIHALSHRILPDAAWLYVHLCWPVQVLDRRDDGV